MIRLFVGVDLPRSLKEYLSFFSHGPEGVNWVPMENLHLTLRFIGETDTSNYRQIRGCLHEITYSKFDMEIDRLGHFGSEKHPKSFWAGVKESFSLLELQQLIEERLAELSIRPAEHKFYPHITIGRVKGKKASSSINFLTRPLDFAPFVFTVNSFQLFSSKLTPTGSIYTVEEDYGLH